MARNRRGLETIIPYFFILVNHVILKVDKSFQLLDKPGGIVYNFIKGLIVCLMFSKSIVMPAALI